MKPSSFENIQSPFLWDIPTFMMNQFMWKTVETDIFSGSVIHVMSVDLLISIFHSFSIHLLPPFFQSIYLSYKDSSQEQTLSTNVFLYMKLWCIISHISLVCTSIFKLHLDITVQSYIWFMTLDNTVVDLQVHYITRNENLPSH